MNKKTGRAPPDWVYKLLDLKFKDEFVSREEIAKLLNISIDTFRKKISRLETKPFEFEYTLHSGQKTVAYDKDELREIFLEHVKDWDDKDV
jgi:biotin operon repressor